MNIEQINQLIEEAYQEALNNPQRILPYSIDNNITLQTDLYSNDGENGFKIICTISFPNINFNLYKVRNYGPDVNSEQDWPLEGIDQAAKNYVAKCINLGSTFVNTKGFDADKKVILLNKLLNLKEQNLLESKPKLIALYQWFNYIEQQAISGKQFFSNPPYTFEEVIAE
jgi:hypothetical protein